MANFMDLPKAVREKIYRLHLVADEQPVDFTTHKVLCGYDGFDNDDHPSTKLYNGESRKMPPLLHVSRQIEREASQIFFGENTFLLDGPTAISVWKRFMWPRHVKYIRRLLVSKPDTWYHDREEVFHHISKLPGLEWLVVVLDEKKILSKVVTNNGLWPSACRALPNDIFDAPYRPRMSLDNLKLGPQVCLQLLRYSRIAGLRSIRGLKHVAFIKSLEAFSSNDPDGVGSFPGGLLETTVRHEMMLPRGTQESE
jgi:hypothetical protein